MNKNINLEQLIAKAITNGLAELPLEIRDRITPGFLHNMYTCQDKVDVSFKDIVATQNTNGNSSDTKKDTKKKEKKEISAAQRKITQDATARIAKERANCSKYYDLFWKKKKIKNLFVKDDSKLRKSEGWSSLYGIDFRYQRETDFTDEEQMMASSIVGSILTGTLTLPELIVREYSKEWETVEKDVKENFKLLDGEVIDGQFKYAKSIFGFLKGLVRLEDNLGKEHHFGDVKHPIGGMNIDELAQYDKDNGTAYVDKFLDYEVQLSVYYGITGDYAALVYLRTNTSRIMKWWDILKAHNHFLCDLTKNEVVFDPNELSSDITEMQMPCDFLNTLTKINVTETGKFCKNFELRMSYIRIWIVSFYIQYHLDMGTKIDSLPKWSDSDITDWWQSSPILHDENLVNNIYDHVKTAFSYVSHILLTADEKDVKIFKGEKKQGWVISLIMSIQFFLHKNKDTVGKPNLWDGQVFLKSWLDSVDKLTVKKDSTGAMLPFYFEHEIKEFIKTNDWSLSATKNVIYDNQFVGAYWKNALQAHCSVSHTKKSDALEKDTVIGIPGLYWQLNHCFIRPNKDFDKDKHNPKDKYADWGVVVLDEVRTPPLSQRQIIFKLQNGYCPFSGNKIDLEQCNAHDIPYSEGGSYMHTNCYGCLGIYNTSSKKTFPVLFEEIHGEAGVTLEEYRRRIKDGEIVWGITKKI